MNECDVHYRQSSNKRLLVELTLIQIGQITQPEDQDVPSAGRTPHRLKSLFQKIIAQLKPAAQGAGAGQESGSTVSSLQGEAASAAAATAAPTSYASASSASDGASVSGASTSGAPAARTKKKLSQVNLSGIGMSFANLKKSEETAKRIYNPIDQLKDDPAAVKQAATSTDVEFTQEQVEGQWMGMCLRMQNVKDLIGLASRMKAIVPTITQYPNIEVVIDNQLLLNDILNIKGRILQTFKIGLGNQSVNFNYRLAEADEVTKVLSKRELLENLMKENPSIAKLTQDLKLVMA